jgi:hypothetical protein
MFNKNLIAPCGINCRVCIAFIREKNKCSGCLSLENQFIHSYKCQIKLCEKREKRSFTYCYECESYPCSKIKKLNKRYTTKYNTNIIENFDNIKNLGMKNFLKEEEKKWKCKSCGEVLSMHKNYCVKCGEEYRKLK